MTAAALAALAPLAQADPATADLCSRPAFAEVCRRLPVTQWICYHVHDPDLDFCIPPLPPGTAA
jgi:hypothetical protein